MTTPLAPFEVAAAYGIGQPHVSRQIGELERECGGQLFQRTGRSVVLTALGQCVARHSELTLACRAVMSGIQQLVKAGGTRL